MAFITGLAVFCQNKANGLSVALVRMEPHKLIFGLVVLACLPRLILVFSTSYYSTPDSRAYIRVAENIASNFCVSRSDPVSGLCEPSWGAGNQLPGYAAFIAVAWLFGKHSLIAVLLLQSLAAGFAIGRLAYAVLV